MPSSPLERIGFCPPAWDVIPLSQLHSSKYFHGLYNSAVFPGKLGPSVWYPRIHRAPGSTRCEQSLALQPNLRQTESLSQDAHGLHGGLETSQPERSPSAARLRPIGWSCFIFFLELLRNMEREARNVHREKEGIGYNGKTRLWGRDRLAFCFSSLFFASY